ncbi:hypothetical protein PR202_gb20990 [Eleusine coracana subsp. coracana]|uniref:AAA+ ATPase domain-containing protein n=1 Tax=Eleusine coracana subsp. coracana TaxID=191504 RepID=A0AAV5FE01_ELECO|nr:hypothetical protein PR202_gb20990 [Eleusine coracana subsp. coracana]
MDPSAAAAAAAALPSSYAKVVEAYKVAVGTAASMTAYAVLARGMARELLPHDLRAAARWVASLVRARLEPPPKERRTLVIKRGGAMTRYHFGEPASNELYEELREYLATRIDPHAMRRLCLSGGGGDRKVMSMENGASMTDVFEGVEFTWTSVEGESKTGTGTGYGYNNTESLEVSFDAEHMDMALGRYIPFITAAAEETRRQHCTLQIFMNESTAWRGITHQHPATFDTLAMDLALKQSIIDDLDRFRKRKEHYQRIGKAWKRGYLLYGPPGTGKSSLVAAIANHLRFNLFDLDLSEKRITLSGLLNFIDGLWSTSGEERIIIFTTNYKDRLDPALLRPGRMDMHIYMGYCCWEAFKTLARNYFVIDDHQLFPEIQELLSDVEVTPAEVSEMLLRSEDVDVALQVLAEFLGEKQQKQEAEN